MRPGDLLTVLILGGVLFGASLPAKAEAPPYVWLGGYWIDEHEKYAWSYFAQRPGPPEGRGPHGAQRPCIAVSAIRRESRSTLRSSENELCYGSPHFLTAESEPLLVSNTVFATSEGSATAFGVAAAPAARKLRIVFRGGRHRTIALKELNKDQAERIRLRPFRHAGFLLRGDWCIELIVVLNESGHSLWEERSPEPCGTSRLRLEHQTRLQGPLSEP